MRSLSPKRAKQQAAYRKIRVEFLSNNPYCHVENINTGIPCRRVAGEVHHMRGRIGELLCNPTYFLAVCRGCHRMIEENPSWARDKGYIVNRYIK